MRVWALVGQRISNSRKGGRGRFHRLAHRCRAGYFPISDSRRVAENCAVLQQNFSDRKRDREKRSTSRALKLTLLAANRRAGGCQVLPDLTDLRGFLYASVNKRSESGWVIRKLSRCFLPLFQACVLT